MGAENRGYRILILALATWGGVGLLPFMPGTWGTLAALPLWYYCAQTGPWVYGLGVAALVILGLGVAGPAQEMLGRTDHGSIVVDEVAGLFITLAGVSPTWSARGPGPGHLPDPGHPETVSHPLVRRGRQGGPGSNGRRRGRRGDRPAGVGSNLDFLGEGLKAVYSVCQKYFLMAASF